LLFLLVLQVCQTL